MEDLKENTWYRDGRLLYTLMHHTNAATGLPHMVNRLTVRVDSYPPFVPVSEVDELATRIHMALSTPPIGEAKTGDDGPLYEVAQAYADKIKEKTDYRGGDIHLRFALYHGYNLAKQGACTCHRKAGHDSRCPAYDAYVAGMDAATPSIGEAKTEEGDETGFATTRAMAQLNKDIDIHEMGIIGVVHNIAHNNDGDPGGAADELLKDVVNPLLGEVQSLRRLLLDATGKLTAPERGNYESIIQTNQVLVARLSHYHNYLSGLTNELATALSTASEESIFQEKVFTAWNNLRNALFDEMTGKGELIPATTPAPVPEQKEAWEMPPRILDIKRNESMVPQWQANAYWTVVDYAKGGIKLDQFGQELRHTALFLAEQGVVAITGEGDERVVSLSQVGLRHANGLPPAPKEEAKKGGPTV